jgi:hypothetical protein
LAASGQYLTLDQAIETIAQSSNDNTVLVGGQAVNLWMIYLGIEQESNYLTRDIDLIGSRADAISANARISLPHKINIATMDDSTINSAVIKVMFVGESESRPIDYLTSLYGVDTEEIKRTAMDIAYNSYTIKVIHPVLLMVSKLSNLNIESKRSPEGFAQANL